MNANGRKPTFRRMKRRRSRCSIGRRRTAQSPRPKRAETAAPPKRESTKRTITTGPPIETEAKIETITDTLTLHRRRPKWLKTALSLNTISTKTTTLRPQPPNRQNPPFNATMPPNPQTAAPPPISLRRHHHPRGRGPDRLHFQYIPDRPPRPITA